MRAGVDPTTSPKQLNEKQILRLHQLLHEAKFSDPPGGHLSPAGEYNLRLGVMKELRPELIATYQVLDRTLACPTHRPPCEEHSAVQIIRPQTSEVEGGPMRAWMLGASGVTEYQRWWFCCSSNVLSSIKAQCLQRSLRRGWCDSLRAT